MVEDFPELVNVGSEKNDSPLFITLSPLPETSFKFLLARITLLSISGTLILVSISKLFPVESSVRV